MRVECVREGSWLWRAGRSRSPAERLVEQSPTSRELRAMREGFDTGEHEFQRAQSLRTSNRP